jgi:hypothetical protein
MDILPASKSSDWWTVITDNNTVKGNNLTTDGINGPAFENLQVQLAKAKTVPEQIGLWQAFLKNPANINDTGMPIAKKAFNTWMTDGKMPSNVQTVLSKDPLATLPAVPLAQLNYNKDDPASVTAYANALKNTYGSLKKADGTPEFTSTYLDSVAAGTIPQDTFDTRINNIAVKAATADLKAQGISLADVGGADGLASSGKLADYLNDSTKLASAYTPVSTVTGGGGNDTSSKPGITSLEPYSGSISDVDTQAKMKQVVDTYDPNKGVYRAPSIDASGKLVSNATSPYSNILNGMLSGYKNPYAAGYTNPLKMPETPNLTNIKKSFEDNPTSADLLKLANSAGQPYDPNAKTSLSPALTKMYQPSVTNSAGQPAKPGAPDTTSTTLPVVPKSGEAIVTDTGKVVTPPVVNPPVVNPPVVNPPVVNPPVVNPPVKTADEIAAEKAAAENTSLAVWFANVKRINDLQSTFTSKQQMESWYAAHPEDDPSNLKRYGASATDLTMGEEAKAREAAYNAQQAVEKAAADKAAADKAAVDKIEADRQAGIKAVENARIAAEQKAIEDARIAAEQKAIEDARIAAASGRNPDGGPSSLGPSYNPTSLPQPVTIAPDTVTSTPGWGALARDTVTPISAAQNNLGPFNISNLGAVIGPQAMNSNAGGVASLVSPQVTVQPAVNYTYAPSSQQQLEDQAVNAGYQGDYSDTAAMQGYLNSNAGGVASLVSPQVTVQQQPAAGTNTVLATNPAQTQQTKPAAPVTAPWWAPYYSSQQEAMDVGGYDASAFQ